MRLVEETVSSRRGKVLFEYAWILNVCNVNQPSQDR